MAPIPTHHTIVKGTDNVLYWKAVWEFAVGDTVGTWGPLQSALNTRITYIDKVVVWLNCTAAEGYYLFFYQGPTGTQSLAGPSGTATAGAQCQHPYDGSYGPFQLDQTSESYALGIYPIDGAWTAGDTMKVWLCGRGLPMPDTTSVPAPTPVDLRKISFWRS